MPTVDAKVEGKNVFSFPNNGWEIFINIGEFGNEINGKYLFFSKDREELRKIARDELEYNKFPTAKINLEESKVGDDHVLCLFYRDDSRKRELATRHLNNPKVIYRYWKSERETEMGAFSKKFIDELKKSPAKNKKILSKQIPSFENFIP